MLGKHRDLSLNPRTQVKRQGGVVCACNPHAREAEAGASLGCDAKPQSALRGCQHPAGVVMVVVGDGRDDWQ